MASSGTWADLLATRLRTLEPFALRAIAEAQVAAARAPIAQLQAHRAIAEPFALRAIAEAQEVIAAARAPIAQLQAQLELPAAAPTHATPPAVPAPPPPPGFCQIGGRAGVASGSR